MQPLLVETSGTLEACDSLLLPHAWCLQEGDGISPTAIREILLLRELDHEHIVKLTAVYINRCGTAAVTVTHTTRAHCRYQHQQMWHSKQC
jgi:hypothetical protein